MPEWAEKARIPQDIFGRSHQEVLDAIYLLRASRDHWRERADEFQEQWRLREARIQRAEDRIRDLEAAQARQMATITELRQGIDTALASFCDPQARATDPAAEKFYQRWGNPPEKPESSWVMRERIVANPIARAEVEGATDTP